MRDKRAQVAGDDSPRPSGSRYGETADPPGPAARPSPWEALAILGILLLAAAFRLVRIDSLPPGLFQDEAINLVDSLTILAGAPHLYYREREPLYMYLVAGSEAILGPNPLALRVTSALVGILGVAAGGALARQLFGRTVGLVTAAGLAGSLWLMVISRVGFRAITQPAIECLGLALLWRATRTGHRRDYLIAGGVLGLTLYTYLSARFLPIALVVFAILAAIVAPSWARKVWRGFALAGGAAVFVALPLGWYAWRHPHVLFGRPDEVVLAPDGPFLPALMANTTRVLGMLMAQGDLTWRHNLSGAPVFDPFSFALFLVGGVIALGSRRPGALFAVTLSLVMLVPSALSIDSPHFLRTVGAAPTLYALWALGLVSVARFVGGRLKRVTSGAAAAHRGRAILGARGVGWPAALVIGAGLGVMIIRGGWGYFGIYARSPEIAAAFNTRLARAGQFLAASPPGLVQGRTVFLDNYFRPDRASLIAFLYPSFDPVARAHWLDEDRVGTFFAQDTILPLPRGPSLYLFAGDRRDPSAELANLTTSVIDLGGGAHDRVILTTAAPPRVGESLAKFGEWIEVTDASIQRSPSAGTASVTLHWRVLEAPSYPPSIFVHLEDAAHHGVGQADLPIEASPSLWQPGQEFLTFHEVPLLAGLPPGTYTVTAGVYDKANGQRDPVTRAGRAIPVAEFGALTLDQPIGGAVSLAQPIQREIAPGLIVAGVDRLPPAIEAGATLPVTLAWEASGADRPADQARITLTSPDGALLGEWRGIVGGNAFSTDRWARGTTIRQIIDLPVLPTAGSGPARLAVDVALPGGAYSEAIDLGRLNVTAPSRAFQAPRPRFPLSARFTDVGDLIGYDLPDRAYAPGESVPITLYWRASGPSPTPYTVFIHAIDARSQIIGQRDEPPMHGGRPTTGWIAGEYLEDPHGLALDPGTPSGEYSVEVGLYDPRTGQRVPVDVSGDRVLIGPLRVGPPGAALPPD